MNELEPADFVTFTIVVPKVDMENGLLFWDSEDCFKAVLAMTFVVAVSSIFKYVEESRVSLADRPVVC